MYHGSVIKMDVYYMDKAPMKSTCIADNDSKI